MTPESMALTGDGAAGWASGSQIWPNGHMPILIPKPTRKRPKAMVVAPALDASIRGRFALTVGKSYLRLAAPLAEAPAEASTTAPIMVAAQAICIMTRYLLAARTFSALRCSKRIRAYPGRVINCQKMKKNHIMSVVLVSPYIAARKSRKYG